MRVLELKSAISKGHKSISELAEDIYVIWRTEKKKEEKWTESKRKGEPH